MKKKLSLTVLLLILSLSAFNTSVFAASHEGKAAENNTAEMNTDGTPKKKTEAEEEEPECD